MSSSQESNLICFDLLKFESRVCHICHHDASKQQTIRFVFLRQPPHPHPTNLLATPTNPNAHPQRQYQKHPYRIREHVHLVWGSFWNPVVQFPSLIARNVDEYVQMATVLLNNVRLHLTRGCCFPGFQCFYHFVSCKFFCIGFTSLDQWHRSNDPHLSTFSFSQSNAPPPRNRFGRSGRGR